ncbi:hypothetical protein NE865_07106 [Phthorimaea operculella]|nr:hypothetical protein NE865_07106 [Phthorimaea operculella]
MEVQSDFVEPATPALTRNNGSFWRAEDSGYHTSSFTPGSVAFSEISNENLDPAISQSQMRFSGQFQVYDVTPDSSINLPRKYVRAKKILSSTQTESTPESPIVRRGVKRAYHDDSEDSPPPSSLPTPTSAIAGGIQKLHVTESSWPSHTYYSSSSGNSRHSDILPNDLYHLNEYPQTLSYPTTPVKKICRTSCKLSPMRRSNKKLNFAIHSLSCESRGVIKHCPLQEPVRIPKFRPNQKIDIIKMLYQDAGVIPPIVKIMTYLPNKDICTFKSVSPLWCDVWNQLAAARKLELEKYLERKKDNQENIQKGLVRKNSDANHQRSLKEVHNLLNTSTTATSTPRSPPGTPRSNKFKKFTKSAQLDQRMQMSCVRCRQPSKVTKEASGEEWAECTSATCSFQFCKFCKCDRHPGKTCFKYDLNGPSPSKRKKSASAACTSKSKRNLYRLMI